jgi:hypothetical protein
VYINTARETIRENIKISAQASLGYYELLWMVSRRMFESVKSKETNQIAMVTGSKPKKWGYVTKIRIEFH